MSSDRVRERLCDIVENADWIGEDLADRTLEQFQRDRTRADAVERCLQRITEAIIQLGEAQATDIGLHVGWRELRNLGNRLRHEYRRIDRTIIYEIAINDIPPLRDAAVRALER